MKRKIDEVIFGAIIFGRVATIVSLPLAYVTAIYSTCGWKGFFVECRIVDCPK